MWALQFLSYTLYDVIAGMSIGVFIPILICLLLRNKGIINTDIDKTILLLSPIMLIVSFVIALTFTTSRHGPFTPKYYVTECHWQTIKPHVVMREHLYKMIPNTGCKKLNHNTS